MRAAGPLGDDPRFAVDDERAGDRAPGDDELLRERTSVREAGGRRRALGLFDRGLLLALGILTADSASKRVQRGKRRVAPFEWTESFL